MLEADVKVEAKLGLRSRLTHWQVKVVALLPREAGTPEHDCYGQARFDSFLTFKLKPSDSVVLLLNLNPSILMLILWFLITVITGI